MSTSGSSNFSVSRDDIIKDALLEIGALDAGEDPSSDETSDASRMLNMLVKNWQVHTDIWPLKDVTVTLTPGTQSYTVGTGLTVNTARPLKVISARRQDSNSVDIPIDVYSREEYMSLPVKSTQAPANGVYYDPQVSNGVLYVWPTGSTNNTTVIITVARPLEDFDSTTDTPDFPQEWYLALVKNLAVRLQRQYTGRVDTVLATEAIALLEELKQFNSEPVSIQFCPER
jgi:hypothetical protein